MVTLPWPHPLRGQLVIRRLVLLVAKPCTKFEVCSFSRSEDISLGIKFRLEHGMINLPTKFEVPTFSHYANMKGIAKHKKWDGLGFDIAHTTSCQPSIITYAPILHHFWDIARYWSKSADSNLPHLYLAPALGVIWLEFHWDFWRQKTGVPEVSYGVVSEIQGIAIYVQLRLVMDGQTDGQTHDDN